MTKRKYRAVFSSDWNQCLAPCGPFDPIAYHYPELMPDLSAVFNKYTGNQISLGTAVGRINKMLPARISSKQMDDYLDNAFVTYKGVPELIAWCAENDILFMVNTTGATGYFQRVLTKGLLPKIPAISANPMIRYPDGDLFPSTMLDLHEIQDKGKNTARAMELFAVHGDKIFIMGDSGGDGAHFEWGRNHQAFLIGSMTKNSLIDYCGRKNIKIDLFWGPAYDADQKRQEEKEMVVDFMELTSVLEQVLK